MKRFPLVLFVLIALVMCAPAHAQSYDFLPKKSRKLTNEEWRGKRISPTLQVYLHTGEVLDPLTRIKYMSSPDYTIEVFGNREGEPVAMVMREATEAEREAKLQLFMGMDNIGEWKDKEAIPFAAMDMEGNGINLKELKGSVVAVNFWYIGCKPCILEMPELNELVAKYEGQNVKFIALALDAKEKLIPFLQRTEFDYTVIPNARNVARLYNVEGYPTHFLIDKNGKVVLYKRGYNGALVTVLDKTLEQLLAADEN